MATKKIKKLEAFEMWVCRRRERISWTDKIRNRDVLRRVEESRTIVDTIVRRKKNWVGRHVMGCNGLMREAMEREEC